MERVAHIQNQKPVRCRWIWQVNSRNRADGSPLMCNMVCVNATFLVFFTLTHSLIQSTTHTHTQYTNTYTYTLIHGFIFRMFARIFAIDSSLRCGAIFLAHTDDRECSLGVAQ